MTARTKINPCRFVRIPGVGKMIRSSRKLPGGAMIVEYKWPCSASMSAPRDLSRPSTKRTSPLGSGCKN
jgi:hypothetical protein